MKFFFTPLFIILSIYGWSQTTFQYGPNIGVSGNYRLLTFNAENDPLSIYQIIIYSRNEREKLSFRPSLGLDFKVNFNEKVGVRTGILYDLKGVNVKVDSIWASSYTDTYAYRRKEFAHFVSFPSLFSYKIPLSNKALELSIGAFHNFYIGSNFRQKRKFSDHTETIKKYEAFDYNRYILQSAASVYLLTYPMKKSQELRIGADFKFALNSLTGKTPIREHVYSFSFNCGILF